MCHKHCDRWISALLCYQLARSIQSPWEQENILPFLLLTELLSHNTTKGSSAISTAKVDSRILTCTLSQVVVIPWAVFSDLWVLVGNYPLLIMNCLCKGQWCAPSVPHGNGRGRNRKAISSSRSAWKTLSGTWCVMGCPVQCQELDLILVHPFPQAGIPLMAVLGFLVLRTRSMEIF